MDDTARKEVSIRRTRQELLVVTAFMRLFAGSCCSAPINRGTTNGLAVLLFLLSTAQTGLVHGDEHLDDLSLALAANSPGALVGLKGPQQR